MLNMLLAVIMDVYTQVKTQTTRSETLVSQGIEIWSRWRARRKGIAKSLEYILQALDPTDLDDDDGGGEEEEDMVTVQNLMGMVEGLPQAQALQVVSDTLDNDMQNVLKEKELSLSAGVGKVSELASLQEQGLENIKELMQMCAMMADRLVQGGRQSTKTNVVAVPATSTDPISPSQEAPPPTKLLLAFDEAVARRIERPLQLISSGRDVMLRHADTIGKTLDSRLGTLDRKINMLMAETHRIVREKNEIESAEGGTLVGNAGRLNVAGRVPYRVNGVGGIPPGRAMPGGAYACGFSAV